MICKLLKFQSGFLLIQERLPRIGEILVAPNVIKSVGLSALAITDKSQLMAIAEGVKGYPVIAQSTSLKIEETPYVELTYGYTLKDHKVGDGIIRIYNSEGHVYCMYPYHRLDKAREHLESLNTVFKACKLTKEHERLLWMGMKFTCEENCACHTECPKADEYISNVKDNEYVTIRSTFVCTNYDGKHSGVDCNCKTGLVEKPFIVVKDGNQFVQIKEL